MGRPRKSAVAGAGIPETRLALNRRGVWEIRWTEFDAVAGVARSRAHSCKTSDRGIAERVRQTWLVAGLQVQQTHAGALLDVAALVESYRADKGFGEKSSQGWALRPVVRLLGGVPVGGLTPAVLLGYRRTRGGERAAGPTIRRELGALKAALSWGRAAGLVPADVQPVITLPAEGAPKTRWLTAEQEEKIWNMALAQFTSEGVPFRERRAGLFVLIALETAAREAAIRGLTWDRVDLARGLIDFRDPTLAVTKKRRVPIPISDRLRPVLERAKAEALAEGDVSPFVLRSSGEVRKGFEALRDRTGVFFTIHDMRRTWASLRVQWGVPLEQVAAVLGDTIEVTQKHYAHFAPDFLLGAINARPPAAAA